YLPLYPVAEWLVTNWWFLLYEVEPRPRERDHYRTRHSLRFAGEGFALPPVLFVPIGPSIEVHWWPAEFEHQRIEFTEFGRASVDAREFQDAIIRFARSVVARLHEFEIHNTVLESELASIEATTAEEAQFCAAAAALGIDPYSIEEAATNEVIATAA